MRKLKRFLALTSALAVLMSSNAVFAKTLVYEDYDNGFASTFVGSTNKNYTLPKAYVEDGLGALEATAGSQTRYLTIAKSLPTLTNNNNFVIEVSLKPTVLTNDIEVGFMAGTTKSLSMNLRQHFSQATIAGKAITALSGVTGWYPNIFASTSLFNDYRFVFWTETEGETTTNKFNLYRLDNPNGNNPRYWRLMNATPYTYTGTIDKFFICRKETSGILYYDYIRIYDGAGTINETNLHTIDTAPIVSDEFNDTSKTCFEDYGYDFGKGLIAKMGVGNRATTMLSLKDGMATVSSNGITFSEDTYNIKEFTAPANDEYLVIELDYLYRNANGQGNTFGGTSGNVLFDLKNASGDSVLKLGPAANTWVGIVDKTTNTQLLKSSIDTGVNIWEGGPVSFKLILDGETLNYDLWVSPTYKNGIYTKVTNDDTKTYKATGVPVKNVSKMTCDVNTAQIDNYKIYTIKKTETATVPDFVNYETGLKALTAAIEGNKEIITATAVNGAVSGTLITAFYDADDRFVDCVQTPVNVTETDFPQLVTSKVALPADATADWDVKAYFWDGISTMKPWTGSGVMAAE